MLITTRSSCCSRAERPRASTIFLAVLLLGASSFACGDDAGDEESQSGGASLNATLVTITAEDARAPITTSHKVSLLGADGKALSPPVETTTSSVDGKVMISEVPSSAVSIYVEGVGADTVNESTYDTVVLNHNWESGETLLRISSRGTIMLAEMVGDYKGSPDRAAVSGAVYWTPGGKARMGAVGCAKLYIDGKSVNDEEQSQRYVGPTGLPATLAARSSTVKDAGRFYFGNVTPGEHTIKVSIDDGKSFIAETKFTVTRTRKDASSPTKSILYQLGIDVDLQANPTPADCT